MAMMDLIGLGLRGVQFVFTIIELGLTGWSVHEYDRYGYYSYSPSRINFLLFASIWTLLALVYLALTPRFFAAAAHKFAILAVDALTMLFWFAGFIALAVWKGDLLVCGGRLCDTITAAIVFAAFLWLLFLATTILAALHVWKTRNGSSAPAEHKAAGTTTV